MPLTCDRCICVRKVEYSETSQVLTLFSLSHGLLRVIAKGAHRRTKAGASRFDGGVDTLDVGEAVFSFDPAKEMHTLTEWSLRDGNLPLRKNLRGMYLGLYAAELISHLIEEHDAHGDLFAGFESLLGKLAGEGAEESFLAFELDLLREAGLLADFSRCGECGGAAGESEHFSPIGGGLVCPDCEPVVHDRVHIDSRLIGLVRRFLTADGPLPGLTRRHTEPINRVFAMQVANTIGKPLRMPRYVIRAARPKSDTAG